MKRTAVCFRLISGVFLNSHILLPACLLSVLFISLFPAVSYSREAQTDCGSYIDRGLTPPSGCMGGSAVPATPATPATPPAGPSSPTSIYKEVTLPVVPDGGSRVLEASCDVNVEGDCNGATLENFTLTIGYNPLDSAGSVIPIQEAELTIFQCESLYDRVFCVDKEGGNACAYSYYPVKTSADPVKHCYTIPAGAIVSGLPLVFDGNIISDVCLDFANSDSLYKPLSFSGGIVQCIEETMANILMPQIMDPDRQYSSVFTNLQEDLRNVIGGLLALYVIFFGFRVILGTNIPSKGQLMQTMIKLIVVIYFSLGTGMTDWLPHLIKSSKELASIMLDSTYDHTSENTVQGSAGINSLLGTSGRQWSVDTNEAVKYDLKGYRYCDFSGKAYPDSFSGQSMGLWDTVDCKIRTYMGSTADSAPVTLILFILAVPSMGLGLVWWGIPIFIFGIIFLSFIILLLIRIVHIYIIAFIAIMILGYVAPLIIPSVLFEKTKSIFEAWLKQLIVYAIQPMVLFAGLALFFGITDAVIYGNNHLFDNDNKMISYKTITGGVTGDTKECNDNDAIGCIFERITIEKYDWDDLYFFTIPIYYYTDPDNEGGQYIFVGLLKLMILCFIGSAMLAMIEDFSTQITAGSLGAHKMSPVPVPAPHKMAEKAITTGSKIGSTAINKGASGAVKTATALRHPQQTARAVKNSLKETFNVKKKADNAIRSALGMEKSKPGGNIKK